MQKLPFRKYDLVIIIYLGKAGKAIVSLVHYLTTLDIFALLLTTKKVKTVLMKIIRFV